MAAIDPYLALESLAPIGIGRAVGVQYLDRDDAIEPVCRGPCRLPISPAPRISYGPRRVQAATVMRSGVYLLVTGAMRRNSSKKLKMNVTWSCLVSACVCGALAGHAGSRS